MFWLPLLTLQLVFASLLAVACTCLCLATRADNYVLAMQQSAVRAQKTVFSELNHGLLVNHGLMFN